MEIALELMPEIVGDETVGVKYAINGVLSVTYDGMPLLGETPEVRGLWSAAAIWIKEGPGAGKTVAELIVHGESEIDVFESNIARAYPCQKTRTHIVARASEGFNKMYGIVHPGEQWESDRRVRLSPFYEREQAARTPCSSRAPAGSGPNWYESNAPLLDEYGDRVTRREAEWESRWWSPIINAEHLAMRDRAAMIDLTAFAIFDVTGPAALDVVQRVAMRQMDVADRPRRLHAAADPQRRLQAGPDDHAPRRRRVPRRDRRRLRDVRQEVVRRPPPRRRLRADPRPDERMDARSGCGARARETSSAPSRATTSPTKGLPFARCKQIEVGPLQVLASRISYVGDLGWELYVPIEQGARLWDIVAEAGAPHGIIPAGIGVYGTTGRLEKCYRAYGAELEGDFNVVEAGMAWGKVKDQDFVGKEAHVRHREEEPAAIMCTLTVDDHTSKSGVKRYMLGHEPILTRAGEPLTDRKGRRSYVTSAGAGPSTRQAHPDGLPAARARRRRRGAGRRVHGRALPGDGRHERLDAGVRPRQLARALLSS